MVDISTAPAETPREGDSIPFVRSVNGVEQLLKMDGSLAVQTSNGSIVIAGEAAISRDPVTGVVTIHAPTIILGGDWPTSDPNVKGQFWVNGGFLMISPGDGT